MKLIDLLVKKTEQDGWAWPGKILSIVQDGCGICWGYDCENRRLSVGGRAWRSGSVGGSSFCLPELSEDWNTSFVTRAEYEAALAKNDGWIEWGGGECPVDGDAVVDVKFKSQGQNTDGEALASQYYWDHRNQPGDIIAYRLHRDINSRANDDRLEQDLNECIGQEVAPAWNGDGLPPVGTICEAKVPRSITGWEWREVKVVESGIQGAEKEALVYDLETTSPSWADEFRPIRSEADKKRDEITNAIASALFKDGDFDTKESLRLATFVYGDIAAGKIPGVKLEGK